MPSPDCGLCGLCSGRKTIVMPSGDLDSNIALVGEAPGENEDIMGIPFVGRSGKLLDGIMAEVGLQRSKVMITNTVKCRPPNNRDPTEEEMKACRPFLDSELCDKDLVVGLGKSACRDLLGFDGRMADIVNTVQTVRIIDRDVPFIPTYHPAACIYNKDARLVLKKTMELVKEKLRSEHDL